MRCLIAVIAFGVVVPTAHAATPVAADYKLVNRTVVGGPGRWDYLSVDAAAQRLFISRSDRVMVTSLSDGKVVGEISGTEGVHGIALVPSLHRGYTSNGRGDSVTVFDLASLKTVDTFKVNGHNPDAIVFDPSSKHLFTLNGRSKDASILDASTGKEVATLPLGGKPEFAVADGKGHLFVNIEDTAELVSIDTAKNQVLHRWPLAHCEEPSGLAMDLRHERAFSTCQNGTLAITNTENGKAVASVPIGKGPDAAAFDADRGLVFSSNGEDGTITVIHEDSEDKYSVVATVATQKSARTMVLDSSNHRIYSVAAEFGVAPAATEKEPHPRAPLVEGSFTVLTVGSEGAKNGR